MLLDPQTLEITIITQILYVPYILKVYEHVAVDASIKSVAVNNTINPCKISFCKGFYNCNFYVIFHQKRHLDKF